MLRRRLVPTFARAQRQARAHARACAKRGGESIREVGQRTRGAFCSAGRKCAVLAAMARDARAELVIGPAFGRTRWLTLLAMRAERVRRAGSARSRRLCGIRPPAHI